MKNSELIDKLVEIADGNVDLVRMAIRASAKSGEAADLKDVVKYIVHHREKGSSAECAPGLT